MSRVHAALIAGYSALARLHPPAFRDTFACEMQVVFAALLAEAAERGCLVLVRVCLRELLGLLASLGREHWQMGIGPMSRTQRVALSAVAGYALVLAFLGLALHLASPGPEHQELLGVGIGRHGDAGGIVYLSGRRLRCGPTADARFSTRCTLEVAGQTLELLARRNPPEQPMQFGGSCAARYAGREWPCEVGSRHVHVHWFAYLDEPLGLSQAQLDALRRQHPVENLPENAFVLGALATPLVTAVAPVVAVAAWPRRVRRRGAFGTLVVALVLGMAGLVGGFVLAGWATVPFWD
jgi:hypothetical protein